MPGSFVWEKWEGPEGGRAPALDSGKGDPIVTVWGRIFAFAKKK